MTRPAELSFLADENIHPDVVTGLRTRGHDVTTVVKLGLAGCSDLEILRAALDARRAVLTHDSDFGTLAILQGEPWSGIVYVRPGHISPDFVLQILDAVRELDTDLDSPFLLVAARRGQDVRIRVRRTADTGRADEAPG
jgi:predicted nuclease of predicted toxin-antitoxin system